MYTHPLTLASMQERYRAQEAAADTFASMAVAHGGTLADAGQVYTALLDTGADAGLCRCAYLRYLDSYAARLHRDSVTGKGSAAGRREYEGVCRTMRMLTQKRGR
jgi:hypothetical protein